MTKIILPKEIDINIDVDICKGKHHHGNQFEDKEIEGRRKVFSGEDFRLE